MKQNAFAVIALAALLPLMSGSCRKDEVLGRDTFVFGADLSYVNQILDHGGMYRENGVAKDPYRLFRDHGANLVRLRLWHDPSWTGAVYGPSGSLNYNDFRDVKLAIKRSKDAGLAVCLDFHYSDTWADPQKQHIPSAWKGLDYETLKDSVYRYTLDVLTKLDSEGLMPEMVQVGNEINPGMLLPLGGWETAGWERLGGLINAGIRGVREAAAGSSIKPQIILHVAQPEYVRWWFDKVTTEGRVTDFDIVGFSYYSKWSEVKISEIDTYVADFRKAYDKTVMVVETAYPWTADNADSYGNIFGSSDAEPGYPLSKDGQLNYLADLTREIREGGGMGIMVWEPAWISSSAKDLWGTGSAWDNCTFFDFGWNVHKGIDFMTSR